MLCEILADGTTLTHSYVMKKHLSSYLQFSLSRFFNLQGQKHYFRVHFDRHSCTCDLSCNCSFQVGAYIYICVCGVIKVSLVLLEHLHYIMEKGNPVVYLSACNVAQGVDQGS